MLRIEIQLTRTNSFLITRKEHTTTTTTNNIKEKFIRFKNRTTEKLKAQSWTHKSRPLLVHTNEQMKICSKIPISLGSGLGAPCTIATKPLGWKISSTSGLSLLKSSWTTQIRFCTTQTISEQVSTVSQTAQTKKMMKQYEDPATKLLYMTEQMAAAMKKKKYSLVWGYLGRLRFEKIQPTENQYTMAIEAYAKQSKIDKVLEVIEEMKQKYALNVRTYNALIECKAKCTHNFDEAKWQECLDIVEEMKKQSLHPRTQTYEILMKIINPPKVVRSNTFPAEKRLEIAKKLFEECGWKRIPYSPIMFANLLTSYKNQGKWNEIAQLYDILAKTGTRANFICLNIFWEAFRTLGNEEMAATMERLRNDKIKTIITKSNNGAVVSVQKKKWYSTPMQPIPANRVQPPTSPVPPKADML